MKLNKDCVSKVFNLIVGHTSFSDEKIVNQKDFNTDTFTPQPIFISEIIKECPEFSAEEIKTVLHILENENLISIIENKDTGRLDQLTLTSYGYSKAFRDLLNSCI